jgi:anti-sigma factor RsiW
LGGLGEPRYVQEALMSHRTSMLRAAMVSQVETPNLDAGEISRAARLKVPVLPPGWKVLDAQIFPSDDGPSLFLLVDAGDGRRLGLFAVRSDTIVSGRPIVAKARGDYLAYWEAGDFAYVLTGARSRGEVAAEARELAANTRL